MIKQYLSLTERINYQDMIDRNAADNEIIQEQEINQIEYEKIIEHTPATHNTDDFELFVFNGKCKVSGLMKAIDNKLPPANILERGSDAIRKYWNAKAKRQGESRKRSQ